MTTTSTLEELCALAPECFRRAFTAVDWLRLEQQYRTPARSYHNLDHILAVARCWRQLHVAWAAADDVFGAVLLHDAVYEPLRNDNEARSAKLAHAWLGQVGIDVERVTQLIQLTATHAFASAERQSGDAGLFLDCDLAILGAERLEYERYARGIAEEYRAVPRWLFKRKRRAFLSRLLRSACLFHTDLMQAQLGQAARENIAWELEALLR